MRSHQAQKGTGSKFIVSFTGPSCKACGAYDYFDDLACELHDEAGIKTRIAGGKQDTEAGDHKATYIAIESSSLDNDSAEWSPSDVGERGGASSDCRGNH